MCSWIMLASAESGPFSATADENINLSEAQTDQTFTVKHVDRCCPLINDTPLTQLRDLIAVLQEIERGVAGRCMAYPMTAFIEYRQHARRDSKSLVDPGIDSPLNSRQLFVQPSTPVIIPNSNHSPPP